MSEESQVLIVVDVQKGFVTPQSEHVVTALENLQYEFDYVVFTKFYNPDPSPFRKLLNSASMAPQSPETELALTPREDAVIISRPLYSCVTEALLVRLKTWGLKEVFIAGIGTETSVLKSVTDLFELNIRPWVLKDLCASEKGAEFHDPAIAIMSRLIGQQHVITCNGAEANIARS